jgi:hypothetical protein
MKTGAAMAYPKISYVTGSEQALLQCGRPPEQQQNKSHRKDVFAHYRTPAIDPANYPEN